MTIGENIRQIRKEKGLTQKALGELCGINESQIRRYELGLSNSNPKLETLQKIAHALGVAYTDLFTFKKYEITLELLTNRPDIKKHLVDNVVNVCGLDETIKEILKCGRIEEIVKVLNAIISHIEVNEELKQINIHFCAASKRDKLLKAFECLNESGKDEAIKQIELLAKVPEYKKDPEA